jgi:hypothetical protein
MRASISGSVLHVGRFALTRLRLGVLLALAVALGASSYAPKAMAAAEVHRLNLVLSGMPSQVSGDGMNDLIRRYNEYPLESRGLEPLDEISMSWMFDSELRYFVRPNFAVAVGVSYLKVQSKRSYLPSIGANIDVLGQVIAVPIHVGAQYYLAAYNQGDFQARAFVGGGLLSLVSTRALFQTSETGLNELYDADNDTLETASLGGANRVTAAGDGAGYYAEVGAHLFFAARYSVMVGAVYRSMKVSDLTSTGTITVPKDVVVAPYLKETLMKDGKPAGISELDLSGVGVRMALGIGF